MLFMREQNKSNVDFVETREPVRGRAAVTESQRETGRDPVRARERARERASLREQVRANGLKKRG